MPTAELLVLKVWSEKARRSVVFVLSLKGAAYLPKICTSDSFASFQTLTAFAQFGAVG